MCTRLLLFTTLGIYVTHFLQVTIAINQIDWYVSHLLVRLRVSVISNSHFMLKPMRLYQSFWLIATVTYMPSFNYCNHVFHAYVFKQQTVVTET